MSDASVVQARLVGALFVDRGLLTPEQLERALEMQAERGELLGEILIAEFGITRVEVASVLAEQWAELEQRQDVPSDGDSVSGVDDTPDAGEPSERRRIGEIFVERGFVTETDLAWALEAQKQSGKPIGELLIERGRLSRMDLASALAEQWSGLEKLRPPTPKRIEGWQQSAPLEHAAAAAQAGTKSEANGSADPALADAISSLANRVAAVETGQVTPDQLDALRTAADTLTSRLDELEARPADTSWRDELAGMSDSLAGRLDALAARLETEAADTRTGLESAREAITGVQQRLDDADAAGPAFVPHEHEEIATLTNRLERTGTALERIAQRVTAVEHKDAGSPSQDEVQQLASELSGRLDALSAELAQRGAADVDGTSPAVAAIDGLAGRLRQVEERVTEQPWRDELHGLALELRGRLDALSAELEQRGAPDVSDMSAAFESRMAESVAAVDRLTERLRQVEERAAQQPWREELQRLAAELSGRLDGLSEALEQRGASEAAEASALAAVNGLADRLRQVEKRATEQPSREELRGLATELGGRLDALSAELERRGTPDVDETSPALTAIDGLADRLRQVEERAAEHPWRGELAQLASELGRRLDGLTQELQNRATADAGAETTALESRVDDAMAAIDRLADRLRQAEQRAADTPLRDEIELLSVRLNELTALAAEPHSHGELRTLHDDLASLAERMGRFEEHAGAGAEERPWQNDVRSLEDALGAIRGELEAMQENAAQARGGIDERLADFDSRLEGTARAAADAAARAEAAGASAVAPAEIERLESMVDEVRAAAVEASSKAERAHAHGSEVSAAARGTLDQLHARVDELAASLREELGAVQTRVGTLGASVEGIGAGTVRGEELQQAIAQSDARFADRLAQYDEAIAVLRRRLEEISVADGMLAERLGGIEVGLRAHVDERFGAIAADTDASRETLEGLGARLSGVERQTWSTPDAIDALRAELASLAERLTVVESAADWQNAMMGLDSRLHVVEETLATPDRSVESRLDELARRLDAEASQADERTRATERALRKGLTALGQQLAESETVYTDAGNALRRSIERLGRAIVETDARISSREEQVEIGPRVDVGSYVAFVPTADGYRLVPVDGSAPQTGAVLQLEDHGQQLVVTRIGVSPIPLDERPCVYLEPLGGDASS